MKPLLILGRALLFSALLLGLATHGNSSSVPGAKIAAALNNDLLPNLFPAQTGDYHGWAAKWAGDSAKVAKLRGDFERFVRAMSRPAERPELPPAAGLPSNDALQALRSTAAKYGIEFVGPPLQ